jgi:hypothetical protein
MGAVGLKVLANGGRGGRAALNATIAIQSCFGAELRPDLIQEVHSVSPPFVLGKGYY